MESSIPSLGTVLETQARVQLQIFKSEALSFYRKEMQKLIETGIGFSDLLFNEYHRQRKMYIFSEFDKMIKFQLETVEKEFKVELEAGIENYYRTFELINKKSLEKEVMAKIQTNDEVKPLVIKELMAIRSEIANIKGILKKSDNKDCAIQ